MLTKGAISNLVNRYRAVLTKCNLMNTFGSLAVASMLVMGGAGVANATDYVTGASAGNIKNGSHTISGEFSGSKRSYLGGYFYFEKADVEIKSGTKFEENESKNNIGGAVYFNGSTSNKIAISNSEFNNNSAYKNGGALGVANINNVTITGGKFEGNTSKMHGGAIVSSKSTVTIDGTEFIDNSCAFSGGAINVNGGSVTLINTKFSGNHSASSSYGAGAICVQSNVATLSLAGENTFENNSTTTKGGAIYLDNAAHNLTFEEGSVTNFVDNSATGNGGAIYNSPKSTVNVNGDVSFSGNTDANGKNDIHNDGNFAINDATVTLDGGITSTLDETSGEYSGVITGSGTLEFTNTDTKVQAKEISEDIKPVASSALNDQLGGDVNAFKRQIGDQFNADNITMKEGFVAPGYENGKQGKNRIMDAALEQASVTSVAIDKILTNDVRKRLGDIRSDKNESGVWMRWDGGKLKGDSGLTNNFNTIQIGGDTKVGKNCRLGVAASFTHGDAEFARGNAQLEGFTFATYATWMGENGMFADVVARLGQFNNEMNVLGRDGKLDNRVFSLSGEYGWRFDFCDQFFVEPQVELAYTYVSSDTLELGNAKYLIDSVDSLTGRAGLVAGWNLPNDMGNVYARASVLQQFMGDAKITGAVTGGKSVTQETDGDDTWLEYGIGANVKLSDKINVWADVERTEGATVEEEWRGTVGLRYSF